MELFRPSGGGLYHWRAFRSQSLWQPFCDGLEQWLKTWEPPRSHLLLIGPSGGYTLPTRWLNSFDKITGYDIDPLAPWFFNRHHRLKDSSKLKFERRNIFWKNGELSAEPVLEIINQHPNASILFSNVLAQIPLEGAIREGAWPGFLMDIRQGLNKRCWASYHDLYTVEPLPFKLHERVFLALQKPNSSLHPLSELGVNLQLIDHLMTSNWSDGLLRHRLGWSLSKRSLHIVECVRNSCEPKSPRDR